MLLSPEQFKRRHRLLSWETQPTLTTLATEVVRYPLIHFMADDDSLGPSVRDLVVNAIYSVDDNADISVDHRLSITGLDLDNHHHYPQLAKKLTREYHSKNREFSLSWNFERALEKKKPLIVNYSLLPRIYEPRHIRRETFRDIELVWWRNIWMNVASIETERAQFIPMEIPSTMKTKSFYTDLVSRPSRSKYLKLTTRPEVRFAEMLEWFITEEHFLDQYLTNLKDTFLVLKDDVNVLYLPMETLVEFKKDDAKSAAYKIEFLYDMVMQLVDARVESEEDDDPTYEEEVRKIQQDAEATMDPTADRAKDILPVANELLEQGAISQKQYDASLKLAERYKRLPNPSGDGTLADVIEYAETKDPTVTRTSIPKMIGCSDEAYLDATVANMDKEYVEKHLEPDLLNTMMNLQKNGFITTSIIKEEHRDVGSHTQTFKLQTKHVKGDAGTSAMEFPKVKSDGTFQISGVTYRMNKQRITVPVAKTGPSEVAMTSAMSKMFMTVGDRKTNDYPAWLVAKILEKDMDKGFEKLSMGNSHSHLMSEKTPRVFAILAEKFKGLQTTAYQFDFTQPNSDMVKLDKGSAYIGNTADGNPMVMDQAGLIRSGETILGTIEQLLDIPTDKKPLEFAEFTNIKGKTVPVGVMLAYWMGIEKFFRYIGVEVTVLEKNARIQSDNTVLRFSDVKVELKTKDLTQDLLVNGFQYFKKSLRDIKYRDLNRRKNYTVIFSERGIGRNQELEYRLIRDLWIDPNTKTLLGRRKEPTEILPLIVFATELLTHRQYPKASDGAYMVTRGYSRLNDIMYKELLVGVREFHRSNGAKRKLTINPKAVRMAILEDAGVSPVEQLNPIAVAGEMERVTYTGAGGRSGQSMMGRHRMFHENDMGVFSEGFTDDGKAGTVLYLTANPNLTSHYGEIDLDGPKELPNLFSNTGMVMPFITKDDAKRGNMARIQLGSWSNARAYEILPIRTGAELTMAHKAGRMFAFVAQQPGKVTKVDKDHMVVEYKDGTVDKYPLGLEMGMAAGKVCPHQLVTDRTEGYRFGEKEILAWDSYFFQRDWYNPTQVAMFTGTGLITAMRETKDTYEDASMLSRNVGAEKLAADMVHIRDILVTFDEQLKLKVKVGDTVDATTIVANLAPVGVDMADDKGITLDYFSKSSPTAKYHGEIVKMETYYCGNLDDAEPGLRKIALDGDKQRKRRSQFMDEFPTGRLMEPTYIGKELVNERTVLVRMYIKHTEAVISGDKTSFCNALKTVPGKIYDTVYTTSEGLPIEAVISYKGILARIVTSPEGIGIGNMLFRQIGLNAAKLYRGQ